MITRRPGPTLLAAAGILTLTLSLIPSMAAAAAGPPLMAALVETLEREATGATAAAAKSGRHPIKVEYPGSLAMAQAGFGDAWRVIYPDEMKKPGFTWSPLTKADDPKDHHDRIDFVYFRGKDIEVTGVKIVGENKENADIVVTPYPSDHRAVVATFTLPNQEQSEKLDSNKPDAGDEK